MRWSALIVFVAAIFAGCSDHYASASDSALETIASDNAYIPPEIAEALDGVSREQSQGLKVANVIVHRAYEYQGYSWIEPVDVAKLIAVDVEFRDYTRGLDLDDVDIIDGQSNENYGSDPHIVNLTLDGTLAADIYDSSWPDDLGPLRVLLIYAFPKKSNTVKLGYWGQELTPQRIPLSGHGPSLPQPTSSE
jgi:hypothetical protein